MRGSLLIGAGLLALGLAVAPSALAQAGYTHLKQLAGVSEAELKKLHGMGPKALDQLRRALEEMGLSFASRDGSSG